MQAIDPIFVAPRLVEREWGRADTGEWVHCPRHKPTKLAEAWLLDPSCASEGGPLGRRISRDVSGMLGDLGRAPPKMRLVFPGQETAIKPTSPLSFWTVLEQGQEAPPDPSRPAHRTGERIRAYEGAEIRLAANCVALEVSASFQATNQPASRPQVIHLPPVSARARATLLREPGLSVETWSLPEWSRIVPDGETCHALVALGPGIRIDGRALAQGETVLVPACGRSLDVVASQRDVKLLAVYPDKTPTTIWRHTPGPDPSASVLPRPEPAPRSVATAQSLHRSMAA